MTACRDIRRYVPIQAAVHATKRVRANAAKLVSNNTAANDRLVSDLDMTANCRVNGKYDAITDRTVMSDVGVHHQVAVRPKPGRCIRRSGPVNTHGFTKGIFIPDLDPGFCGRVKTDILRQVTDDSMGVHPVIATHAHIIMDYRVRPNVGIAADFDVIMNDRIWPYHAAFGNHCIRGNNSGGMNIGFCHNTQLAGTRRVKPAKNCGILQHARV